jgi:lysophospholipase L1-like esterase
MPSEDTGGGLRRLPEVLSLHPDWVTVMYGLNDSALDDEATTARVPVENYTENLKRIIETLRAAGVQPLLMTPNPMDAFGITKELYADRPPYSTHGGINFMLVDYVAAVQQVGAATQTPVLDIFGELRALRDAQQGLQGYLTDGMHPNPTGHQIIADCLARYFLAVL